MNLSSPWFLQPIDRFSALPAEIIPLIFQHLYSEKVALIHPISKRLLPSQQRTLYHDVTLDSWLRLEQICNTARLEPTITAHVTYLMIDIEPIFGTRVPKEAEDPETVSLKDFKQLLESTIHLKKLTIMGSYRLSKFTLSHEIALNCLPKLEYLSLTSSFRSWQDPFHPGHYALLSYYSELSYFRLNVLRSPSSIRPHSKPIEAVAPFLASNMCMVRLTGPLTSSQESVKHLLTLFGFLFSVHLQDSSTTSRIFDLLDGLIEKPALDYLTLSRYPDSGPPPLNVTSPNALLQFRSLTILDFTGTCSSTSPSFYSILHNLPKLETLIFGLDAPVSLEHLTTLVSGRTKHKTLETVILDNVNGEIGTRVEPDGEPYQDSQGRFMVHPDWVIPEWTDTFSREGFVKFLEDMEDVDIVIEGTALTALEVETEWEGEMDVIDGIEEELCVLGAIAIEEEMDERARFL